MSDLTVEELRQHIETELVDAALQLLIDAAEEQLANVPSGEVTASHRGGSRVIILPHVTDSITRIREANETADVDAAEYSLRADGRSIWRQIAGSSEYGYWQGPVTVVSVPRAYASLRKLATIQLIKGAIANNPGILGMTEGNWTIQFQNGSTWSEATEDALAVLNPPWNFA